MAQNAFALSQVWDQLQGSWHFSRKLHSTNAAEPSGDCNGTATFTSRPPTLFVDDEGVFQNASKEMLYFEQGYFEMASNPGEATPAKLSFSRKYVWRLQDRSSGDQEISVWFVKPGTEQVDYLFHKVLLQHATDSTRNGINCSSVECTGGHVCVDDYYNSTYTFNLQTQDDKSGILQTWGMLHEVVGPRKDQVIETGFARAPNTSV